MGIPLSHAATVPPFLASFMALRYIRVVGLSNMELWFSFLS